LRKTKIVPPGDWPVSRIETLASDNNPTISGGESDMAFSILK
jgi:hypothetical protein